MTQRLSKALHQFSVTAGAESYGVASEFKPFGPGSKILLKGFILGFEHDLDATVYLIEKCVVSLRI
jgi:hypothetical protein